MFGSRPDQQRSVLCGVPEKVGDGFARANSPRVAACRHAVGGVSAGLLSAGKCPLASVPRAALARLRAAFAAGELRFSGTLAAFADEPGTFADCLDALHVVDWVVYAERPFAGPEQVLAYLASRRAGQLASDPARCLPRPASRRRAARGASAGYRGAAGSVKNGRSRGACGPI